MPQKALAISWVFRDGLQPRFGPRHHRHMSPEFGSTSRYPLDENLRYLTLSGRRRTVSWSRLSKRRACGASWSGTGAYTDVLERILHREPSLAARAVRRSRAAAHARPPTGRHSRNLHRAHEETPGHGTARLPWMAVLEVKRQCLMPPSPHQHVPLRADRRGPVAHARMLDSPASPGERPHWLRARLWSRTISRPLASR